MVSRYKDKTNPAAASTQTAKRSDLNRSAAHPPWKPRAIEAVELHHRSAISRLFPGTFGRIELPSTAALLGMHDAHLTLTGMGPSQLDAAARDVFAALDGNGFRHLIQMGVHGARTLIDLTLRRAPSIHSTKLSSGEQGTLLLTLATIGADWTRAGGPRFTIRGILHGDGNAPAQYLDSLDPWCVTGMLTAGAHAMPITALCSKVTDHPAPRRTRGCYTSVGGWPIFVAVVIGSTALNAAQLGKLKVGTLVTLDWCSHPHATSSAPSFYLRAGSRRTRVRWLDTAHVIVVKSPDGKETMTDTKKTVRSVHEDDAGKGGPQGLGDAAMQVHIEIARQQMTVDEVLSLNPGAIVPLDTPVGSHVTLCLGEKPIAHGDLVDLNGLLAVEITEIV